MSDDAAWLDTEQLPVLVPRGVTPEPIPESLEARNARVQEAWDALTHRQQKFLDSLRNHQFNARATLRALENTSERLARSTIRDWQLQPAYAFVLKVMKAIARDEVIDPDRLLIRAEEIAEQALAPKPILYKGEATGFEENQPEIALRATELLMKTQKMLGNDQPVQFQQGPAFVIQVVQPDTGKVIDVTPRVKVELPPPAEPARDEP